LTFGQNTDLHVFFETGRVWKDSETASFNLIGYTFAKKPIRKENYNQPCTLQKGPQIKFRNAIWSLSSSSKIPTRSLSTVTTPPPGNKPERAVPYTIWFGWDDGACLRRRREAPAKLPGRRKQTHPPKQARHHHVVQGRRGSGAAGISEREREQPPRRAEKGSMPCHSPLPPQPAKRAKPRTSCSSAQLLLATTAGQEKRDGAASLHNGEADDAIGLLERCWSAAVTTQDFINFWGKFFVFVLLEIIEIHRNLKLLSLFESFVRKLIKILYLFLEELL
jgi:hypothetical protein